MNTASCRSSITYIDGDRGILEYRGYPIEEVCEKSTYLETAYLLIKGHLPNRAQLDEWVHDITYHTYVHENIKKFVEGFRYDAHPMGMLMTTAYILAMDTFGPITDNAGGIAEMSQQPESTRHITDQLDAVGNTTKALTKGYAIASAGLAAFLLFSAYIENVALFLGREIAAVAIDLARVEVFVGALIGAMLVFLFSALAIRAVGSAASEIINEVRRQFRENPGIMQGTVRPDYSRCVDITTRAALREMVAPGMLAVAGPVIVGFLLGWQATGGLLIVGTITGILMATVLNNSGGAWDNAKKYIEAGNMRSVDGSTVIKKATSEHAAAVVGDTVGDPFKDTAGPSLHVLVKLFSTITLVMLPLFFILHPIAR
ncbi:MAG: sodium/proton-translocating pyrophosphatase [Dehalococcoidia bacterium]|nr:sodium/proton-translocating pyrophosphatase [Dehalococcoidia bacterium]